MWSSLSASTSRAKRAAGDDEDLARALALPGKLRLGINVIDCERHVTVAK